MSEIHVMKNETIDSALKRFKQQCGKMGISGEIHKRQYYEKPSAKRKSKKILAEKRKIKAITKKRNNDNKHF